MAFRPLLSNYPRLHRLLQSDPAANKEFNELLSKVSDPVKVSDDVVQRLKVSETNLQKQLDLVGRLSRTKDKQQRLLRLLGEVMESQVDFKPYSEDVATGRKYNIKFDANQMRMVLRIYWDLVAADLEAKLAATADPMEAEEE